MNQPKYRVFVCTRQRGDLDRPENCCFNCGGVEIYQAFRNEIEHQQLANRVEIRQSGCLDRCEAGTVVAVYRAHWQNFAWLPDKIQRKLRKILFPNRHLYGHLTSADIPAIVESHLIEGKPLKQKLLTNTK
ncbi:(2Fe-2S) ferredoxin domain-containing protein [Chamaesiphon sp. VAR_48_metabat_135_sub]|uniref:(2Fe-2S) ferredoxin domain-containing protein n=1 Tax=Chamaesiphon sp. VAR_48_metabat_135_sub TaxID=2964699 RepID=UPI00286CE194|nr:(2Fe-2S) ferredoxin domain-containing protein [Chamaesiphon sp. VAR_48_metabat_135_sub]